MTYAMGFPYGLKRGWGVAKKQKEKGSKNVDARRIIAYKPAI